MNILDKWMLLWNQHSYKNELYGEICFHIILGQILKDHLTHFGPIYLDSRISLMLIQQSGTGKSAPYDFFVNVAKGCGLNVVDLDEITDAALIGTIENIEDYDEETRTRIVRYEQTTGILKDADIIHYDEASILFMPTQYSQHAITYFQKALNPVGSEVNKITKKLAHGDVIEIRPTCSLFLTSYPPKNLSEYILNTGIFQRMITFPRMVDEEYRKEVSMQRVDKWGTKTTTSVDVSSLIEDFKNIRDFSQSVESFRPMPQSIPFTKSRFNSLYDLAKDVSPHAKDVVYTFIPRWENIIYTLSLHSAAMNSRDEIAIPDVDYAYVLCKKIIIEFIKWVESRMEAQALSPREQMLLRRLVARWGYFADKEGWAMKNELIEKASGMLHMSQHSVGDLIKRFVKMGTLTEETTREGIIRYRPTRVDG